MLFEDAYDNAVEVDGVDPEIVAGLRALWVAVHHGDGPASVKPPLVALLEHLCSPKSRTDANCRAVDYFFCLADWSWDSLPRSYQDLFADMGGGLHEAVAAPDIAEALQATPESLLARARDLVPRQR